ncbi:18183_t:CDS:2 [Cetraspora pellucida]|uniref:18183_t:CDS:1 n=1 Tax=Cetraspora pellucida TaxID=1433469 RepID=A0ACA9N6A6_9GLOM|nr:18183_t:CDS:2 [Cetraspora pellucida]
MARMNRCCGCIAMRPGVITITIFTLAGGILGLIQNIQILTDYYYYVLGSSAYVAMVANSLTILVAGFGLIVVCCAESARLLKTFSGLFIFIVFIHYAYAIYITIVVATSGYFRYFTTLVILSFIGAFLLSYFAKVISDYAASAKEEQDNYITPRRMETSDVTNNQVVT